MSYSVLGHVLSRNIDISSFFFGFCMGMKILILHFRTITRFVYRDENLLLTVQTVALQILIPIM